MEKTDAEIPAYLEFAEDPDEAWSIAESKQVFEEPVDILKDLVNAPKREGHARVVCMSDTHSFTNRGGPLSEVPDGDILIHAGDFTTAGQMKQVEAFNEYLGTLSHPHKIVIAGNHEINFHEETSQRLRRQYNYVPSEQVKQALKNCTYLEDTETEVLGLRIYGSPWTPVFCDWAFLKERGDDINEIWEKIPSNIDILITHGPPLGRGDICLPRKTRSGCANLLNIVQNRVKPKFHIFGHIHEGYGSPSSDGVTTYINASSCNRQYRPINKPVVFDIAVNERT